MEFLSLYSFALCKIAPGFRRWKGNIGAGIDFEDIRAFGKVGLIEQFI